MTQQKDETPEHDFPKGVSQPVLRALYGADLIRREQQTTVTETDLLNCMAWVRR